MNFQGLVGATYCEISREFLQRFRVDAVTAFFHLFSEASQEIFRAIMEQFEVLEFMKSGYVMRGFTP